MWQTLDYTAADRPRLVGRSGEVIHLDLRRWLGDPTPADRRLLERAGSPTLDVGCGPGRLAAELSRRGCDVLGLDLAPGAVSLTRERGAPAICCSVFGAVPRLGEWRTALVLDGNLGIGGDPAALLDRLRQLLAPSGLVLAEVEPPGVATQRLHVRLETATGCSGWFGWARVGVDGLHRIAPLAGFRVIQRWSDEGRWFCALVAPERRHDR